MKKAASFPTVILFILLCLAAPLSSAYAEVQGVATVIALRGTAVAQGKNGPGRTLSLKSQIFQEDVLKTDKTGQLQIMFTDNSIISLGRDSEMKIAEYRWQPGQKDGALKTQAKEGTFRVMGGALAKDAPQNFKTETPTATIGIRGSMYAFKSTADSLSVVFQGGTGIEIFNNLGKVVITTPGFGTHVILNAPPARPSRFTEQELNNLNRGLNGNGGNTNNGNTNGGSSGNGGSSSNGTQPPAALVYNNLPPQPVERPVLPPTNELPSSPATTLSQTPPTPRDGIFAFEGVLAGTSTGVGANSGYTDTFINALSMGVNWHNNRIFGVAYDTTGQEKNRVFFFGSANGSTVSDLTVIGADNFWPSNDFGSINGSGSGVFTGTAYDFFSFAATGNTSLIKDASIHDTWVVAGGGQQGAGAVTPVAPRGTENWQGFASGLSANLNAPYTSPANIFQTSPDDLFMTVDKDAGTINGTMKMVLNDSLATLQIGGDITNSVYLRDDLMAALISSPDLKPSGNFMVVADPSQQFSSYCTWGYWEIAYTDAGTDRIMVAPHSLWIAGNPTPTGVIANLQSSNFVGVYNGAAIGTELSATGPMTITGTSTLTADFGALTVSGNINFPGIINLPIPTGSPNIFANKFAAPISGPNIYGWVNGGFFGPAANAAAGNFSAVNSGTGKQYSGIFGGNR